MSLGQGNLLGAYVERGKVWAVLGSQAAYGTCQTLGKPSPATEDLQSKVAGRAYDEPLEEMPAASLVRLGGSFGDLPGRVNRERELGLDRRETG